MSRVEGSLIDFAVRLQQNGEKAVKGVSGIMQTNAEKIRDTAIEYAPILTGALENAIVKNTENNGINGRAVVTVYIDESGEAGKYAADVHEHLAPWGDGSFGRVGGSDLNSLSMQKDGGTGLVGGKFLERAFLFYKDKIRRDCERVVNRAFNNDF